MYISSLSYIFKVAYYLKLIGYNININIQLGSEAQRTQTKEIEQARLFISFVCVLYASLSS